VTDFIDLEPCNADIRQSPLSILLEASSHRVRIAGGVAGGSSDQSGSFISTIASVSETSSPVDGRRPVSISYRTQPNAQMSARLSTALPRACSGAMYAAAPSSMPTPVIIAGEVIVGVSAFRPTRTVPAWRCTIGT
jgi:hypothetical protein